MTNIIKVPIRANPIYARYSFAFSGRGLPITDSIRSIAIRPPSKTGIGSKLR